MSEDIFSQFFNLFNNEESGVNWELAKQINNHITKDEEVIPLELSNNEINFEQIFKSLDIYDQKFSTISSGNAIDHLWSVFNKHWPCNN